jgi:hypothetical protein
MAIMMAMVLRSRVRRCPKFSPVSLSTIYLFSEKRCLPIIYCIRLLATHVGGSAMHVGKSVTRVGSLVTRVGNSATHAGSSATHVGKSAIRVGLATRVEFLNRNGVEQAGRERISFVEKSICVGDAHEIYFVENTSFDVPAVIVGYAIGGKIGGVYLYCVSAVAEKCADHTYKCISTCKNRYL